MWKKFFLLILIVLILGGWYVFSLLKGDDKFVSPLSYGGKIAANLWLPQIETVSANLNTPKITALSAYFVDIDSGQVLYQKDPQKRLPVASLVKVMTAVVTLENHKLSDQIWISEKAAGMEPDSMLLKPLEKLSVEELLDGVFLVSANDGAEALAESFSLGRDEFIKQMNTKASQLNMKDTLFINPTGLEEDNKRQYSTAFDIVIMARYAIKNFPQLVEITKKDHIFIPQTTTHQDYDLYSGINLLTTYPGVKGFKTGYTEEAGLTLITLAEKNGHQVLGVLLNSENRRDEARLLLDYSFAKLF